MAAGSDPRWGDEQENLPHGGRWDGGQLAWGPEEEQHPCQVSQKSPLNYLSFKAYLVIIKH